MTDKKESTFKTFEVKDGRPSLQFVRNCDEDGRIAQEIILFWTGEEMFKIRTKEEALFYVYCLSLSDFLIDELAVKMYKAIVASCVNDLLLVENRFDCGCGCILVFVGEEYDVLNIDSQSWNPKGLRRKLAQWIKKGGKERRVISDAIHADLEREINRFFRTKTSTPSKKSVKKRPARRITG